ncbi:MAG: universal stress protein [Pseudohongiellaceae bacterium]
MQTLRKLLVMIEPEADVQLALGKALKLARPAGADLELMICDHNSYLDDGFYFDPPRAAELRREHVEKNLALLEEMAAVIREQGLSVQVDARWGNPPYEQIIDKVLDSKPDLVVQSTRHHEKIARLLLSHQDWQLLRYCPCPLLLVKDRDWPERPTILVSVDPTHTNDKPADLDDRLTDAGATLAALVGGEVHLYHSSHQPPVSGLYPVSVDPAVYEEKCSGLLARHDLSRDRLHIKDEDIQTSLPALADQMDVAMVVMGALSRSRLDRLFVGNTAEKLLDRLHQDVLVIKPAGTTDRVKKARQANL